MSYVLDDRFQPLDEVSIVLSSASWRARAISSPAARSCQALATPNCPLMTEPDAQRP
jgi:hypothetical protein